MIHEKEGFDKETFEKECLEPFTEFKFNVPDQLQNSQRIASMFQKEKLKSLLLEAFKKEYES